LRLQYFFNSKFEITAIGSSDAYDKYAQEAVKRGIVDILADGVYLDAMKDSMLWWDGTSFKRDFKKID
jgi:hypothetical protein